MNVVTRETKEKSLEAIREKISKTPDPKERHALGTEARELRKQINQTAPQR